jgi:hypothetical protein
MEKFYRFVLCLGSMLLFALGAYLAYEDKVGSATTVFGSAIVCTIFVYLTRFKTFKGFGIQAELWEDKQIEAAKLIDSLKPMTNELGRLLITIAARMGRCNSAMNRAEMLEITENIERLLKALGVTAPEIEKTKEEYYRLTIFDIARPIIESVSQALQEIMKDIDKKLSETQRRGPINPDDSEWNSLINKKSAIESEIKEVRSLNSEIKVELLYDSLIKRINVSRQLNDEQKRKLIDSNMDFLEDLRYFIDKKRVRRPAVWLAE